MRISEMQDSGPDMGKITALSQFLISRAEDTAAQKKISVPSFLKLAGDMGISLTQDQLIDMIQRPPLNNLISDIQNNEIMFKGNETAASVMPVDQARATVDAMAKRAAKKGI